MMKNYDVFQFSEYDVNFKLWCFCLFQIVFPHHHTLYTEMSSGNSPSQHPEETVTKDAVMAEDAPEMATAEDAPEMATAEDAVTAEKTAATAATESSIPFRQ